MARVRITFDVDTMTTYRLTALLDALQRAYEVELAAAAESHGISLVPVPFAAREAAKALDASPELSIERIQMTSPRLMWVTVPGVEADSPRFSG